MEKLLNAIKGFKDTFLFFMKVTLYYAILVSGFSLFCLITKYHFYPNFNSSELIVFLIFFGFAMLTGIMLIFIAALPTGLLILKFVKQFASKRIYKKILSYSQKSDLSQLGNDEYKKLEAQRKYIQYYSHQLDKVLPQNIIDMLILCFFGFLGLVFEFLIFGIIFNNTNDGMFGAIFMPILSTLLILFIAIRGHILGKIVTVLGLPLFLLISIPWVSQTMFENLLLNASIIKYPSEIIISKSCYIKNIKQLRDWGVDFNYVKNNLPATMKSQADEYNKLLNENNITLINPVKKDTYQYKLLELSNIKYLIRTEKPQIFINLGQCDNIVSIPKMIK